MPELQTIPARHGVATYVPAGQVIKIINSSGSQVVDTWAFALPKPDPKKGDEKQEGAEKKEEEPQKDEGKTDDKENEKPTPAKKGKKGANDLPTQEEAEKATKEGLSQGENAAKDAKHAQQKSGWSSYVPSLGFGGSKDAAQSKQDKEQQKKNSKGWATYFPSGQGFSNYVPKSASDTVASFASSVCPWQLHECPNANKPLSTSATRISHTWSSCRTSPRPLLAQQVSKVNLPHAMHWH